MRAYEESISHTSTDYAPWHIVPADHKWFTRVVIAELVIEALESLNLSLPQLSKSERAVLADSRRRLKAEG